jgi:hypothetical protein
VASCRRAGWSGVVLTRRGWLLGFGVLAVAGCVRPAQRAVPPTQAPAPMPQQAAWTSTARSILTDALEALRVFDAFAAYRITSADASGIRSATELPWDPPTSAEWDEATRVATGTHGRAEQVLVAVGRSSYDPTGWRERRAFAEAVQDLLTLGDALAAYRARVDHLAPAGDGSSALGLLDEAWAHWDRSAERWGLSRAEPIACSR